MFRLTANVVEDLLVSCQVRGFCLAIITNLESAFRPTTNIPADAGIHHKSHTFNYF